MPLTCEGAPAERRREADLLLPEDEALPVDPPRPLAPPLEADTERPAGDPMGPVPDIKEEEEGDAAAETWEGSAHLSPNGSVTVSERASREGHCK